MDEPTKLITIAIHTYEKAIVLKNFLEDHGISTIIQNVNLDEPKIASGVRVRIKDFDLPLALKLIEEAYSINTHKKQNIPQILIPIDFSEYSLKTCKIGFDFANKLNAKVILLYSYVNVTYSGSLPFNSDGFNAPDLVTLKDEKELDAISKRKMDSFVKDLKRAIKNGDIPNVEYKTVITEGIPEDSILEYAKVCKASLIVMGTRGKDKKEADLIGSVTAEVLDAGKFPVFTVPENFSLNDIYDIKKAVFFSNLCQQDLISFDIFVRLFNNHPLDITIIPITDKQNGNIDERNIALLKYSEEQYPNFKFTIKNFKEGHKFTSDIDTYIAEQKIDMIIIPNKKRNIFARLFNPSIAHKIIFHADTPMLVVPVQ